MTRRVPGLGAPRDLVFPVVAERTLVSGLSVVAVRHGQVPLAEIRLRVPFAGVNGAQAGLLSRTFLSGTAARTAAEIEAEVQRLGGRLAATADADEFVVSGGGLADGLPRLLHVLGDVLSRAAYPAAEVSVARDRLAQHVRVAKSQPAYAALEALNRLIYGNHPYANQTPDPADIMAVTADDLRSLHAARLRPAEATLFIIGDVNLDAALDEAEFALMDWKGTDPFPPVLSLPPMPRIPSRPRMVALAGWPRAVQACVRVAMPVLPRTSPEYAAFQLAHLIFGGYFSSRLVENLREDKGLAYTPQSAIVHLLAGSVALVCADVPADAAAAALAEIWRELDRGPDAPAGEGELQRARQYAMGSLTLSLASQAGVADTLTALAKDGLGPEWVAEHSRRLATVTGEQVAQAGRYLSRRHAVSLVLGDAETSEPGLAALGEVVRC